MERTPSGGADTAVGDTAVGDAAAGTSSGPLSIGAVLHLLREEFPEVTVSKIRFLESEGLVEPRRSPSGYRKFSSEDVERLSHVLRMQRDHYLPLKVIREYLDALARGAEPSLPAPSLPPLPVQKGPVAPGGSTPRIGRTELLAAAGVTGEELAEWESYGLLGPDPEGSYGREGIVVARLVADLRRCGLQPGHLRMVKAAADREADMVDQVVAPLRQRRNPGSPAEAEGAAAELAALSAQLHAALVRVALRLRSP